MLEKDIFIEFLNKLKTKFQTEELPLFEEAADIIIKYFEEKNVRCTVSDAYMVNEMLSAYFSTLIYVHNLRQDLYKPYQDISNIIFEFISQYEPPVALSIKK